MDENLDLRSLLSERFVAHCLLASGSRVGRSDRISKVQVPSQAQVLLRGPVAHLIAAFVHQNHRFVMIPASDTLRRSNWVPLPRVFLSSAPSESCADQSTSILSSATFSSHAWSLIAVQERGICQTCRGEHWLAGKLESTQTHYLCIQRGSAEYLEYFRSTSLIAI